jgi:hypothetical protein
MRGANGVCEGCLSTDGHLHGEAITRTASWERGTSEVMPPGYRRVRRQM